jgi:rSAM/selenodomain-associated transferase 1
MKTNALIIFTRNPQLGKVKTRLAASIGDENALEIYTALLQHTKSVTQNLDCDKFVFYDQNIEKEDIWLESVYNKKLQFGVDLGAKMQNAFNQLFELGYKNCIIIGSDIFDLKDFHILDAFYKLQFSDVVIGPAEDGGYYLLGIKKEITSIFKNKDWGYSTVLSETLIDLVSYKIDFLEVLNDIDTIEDLEKSKHYQLLKISKT